MNYINLVIVCVSYIGNILADHGFFFFTCINFNKPSHAIKLQRRFLPIKLLWCSYVCQLKVIIAMVTRYDFLLRRRDVGRPSESSVNTVLLLEKLPSRYLPSCGPNILMSMKSSLKFSANHEYRIYTA